MKTYHWMFLAQPRPLPETLIGHAPTAYLDMTLKSWTRAGDLAAFDPEALAAYRRFFAQPAHIEACCNDYRAGATIDVEHDAADLEAGRKIKAPMLALWGEAGIAQKGADTVRVWSQWAERVEGHAVPCGHFLQEEAPDETRDALLRFLRR